MEKYHFSWRRPEP